VQRRPDRRPSLLAVLVPTALNAGLVLYDLTARSIWVDEGATFADASQHGAALWHWIASAAGNMFLYYAAMHVEITLFGAGLVSLRLPSALAEIACVPLGYATLQRLLGRRAAIGGAWMLAIGCTAIFWGQQARGYAPAMAFSAAAGLALAVAVKDGRRAAWVVFALCSTLAIYTILLSALVTVAQLGSLVVLDRPRARRRPAAAALGAIVLACVPLALAALPRGTIGVEWLGAPGTPYGPSYGYLAEFLASADVQGVASTALAVPLAIGTLAAWAAALGMLAARLRRRRRDVQTWAVAMLVCWLAVPPVAAGAFSLLVHPVLQDRYVLTSLPAASMLAGAAIAQLRARALAATALVCILAGRGAALLPGYGVSLENWQGAAAYVSGATSPGDCAAFFVADGYSAFDYYATVEAYRPLPAPVLPGAAYATREPFALDPAVLSPGALDTTAQRCPRLWLLRTHESGAAPPAGSPAFQVLKYRRYRQLLAGIRARYRLVSARPFTGVLVELYRRRGARATAKSTGVSSLICCVTKKSPAPMPLAPPTSRRARTR
jgi:hypothetical protein